MQTQVQQFINDARVRLGNPPSDSELTDTTLETALLAALRDFSRVWPFNRQNLIIWLTPYQEFYTLPFDPDYVIDVVPAAPTTASARAFGNEFRALELDLVDFHIADLETFAYRVSQYREMFEQIEWNYNTPPTLYVTPSPVQAMEAIVIIGYNHTFAATTDQLTPSTQYYEPLMTGTMGFAKEFWGNQRNAPSVRSAPSALGTIELASGDTLIEEGRRLQAEFRDRIGFNRAQIVHG